MTVKKALIQLKRNIVFKLPPKIAHSFLYWSKHHKFMNWKNPKLYDEKIHWLIGNCYDQAYGKYADKYEVRSYVKECGLEKLLIPLKGVYSSVDEIHIDALPQQFILKTTHGSQGDFYEICYDKKIWNEVVGKNKLNKALCVNLGKIACEYHYCNITPRIVCEELLQDGKNKRLTDYKVVCSYGEPKAILVCTNRNEGRDYYSTSWEYLEYVKIEYRSKKRISKPKVLQEMLNAAAILSTPFPLARIDFYIVNDKLYFGEITLTPAAGNNNYLNEVGEKELGSFISI